MTESTQGQSARVLIIGLLAIIIVPGLALVMFALSNSLRAQPEPVNVLANSADECVTCHRQTTPGIVEQYGHSSMAASNVTCRSCHEVKADYPGAVEHEGTFVLSSPSSAMCATCHANEVAQFNQSRHGLPAYVAVAGSKDLAPELIALYEAIPEGGFAPDKSRRQCQKCHIRHEFSLEQARKPETCNNCHIGPDHPQWEIYQESAHGIAYATSGDTWNWEAEPGTLTVQDFPAPTCATCHFSGFGASGTTHDVGERLTWYLFAPISERRPVWQDNQTRMQSVCRECHNQQFVTDFYTDADALVGAINAWVQESNEIVKPLKEAGLMTDQPFDQPIDFTYYELWHHWGRTAKFGAWMQGADYTQWHGAYEMLSDLVELRTYATELLDSPEALIPQATPEASPGG